MQHAITFVIAALCILAIAYRLYGVFFVRKVLRADDKLVTPSHQLEDGHQHLASALVGVADAGAGGGVVEIEPGKVAGVGGIAQAKDLRQQLHHRNVIAGIPVLHMGTPK
jgi:hypothetical protein